jgi:hypothetical protein
MFSILNTRLGTFSSEEDFEEDFNDAEYDFRTRDRGSSEPEQQRSGAI